ncbi:platelet glycoprotein V-like [Clytia hemisphaerica]
MMCGLIKVLLLLVCVSVVLTAPVKVSQCPKKCTCQLSGTFVQCPGKVTRKDWERIGAEISENAIQLEVDFLDFEYVQVHCFKKLKTLTNLRILGGRVVLFPTGLSDKFPALKIITFINNKIRHLTPSIFEGLEEILNLDLAGNTLKRISKNVFKGLSKLKLLNLERNQIECLDNDAFDGLSGLGLLSLNNNRLTMLPDGLFKSFKEAPLFLLFANNRITRLQKNLFQPFLKISAFNVSNNNISEIETGAFDNLLPFPGFGIDLSHNPILCNAQSNPTDFSMGSIRVTGTCGSTPVLPFQIRRIVE